MHFKYALKHLNSRLYKACLSMLIKCITMCCHELSCMGKMHQCLTLYCAFIIIFVEIPHTFCPQLLFISESPNPKHSLQVLFLKEVNVLCVSDRC